MLIDVSITAKGVELDGNIYLYASSRDITSLKAAQNEIITNNDSLQLLLESTHEGMLIFDESRLCIYANKAVETILGYTHDELIGLHILHHVTPESLELIKNRSQKDHALPFEAHLKRKDGFIITVMLQGRNLLLWGKDVRLVGILDITDFKNAQAEIERLAYFDPLTDLPNRRLLVDRMEQILLRSKRNRYYSMAAFIDLDQFKRINDTLGHKAGDLLLIQTAQRLSGTLRGSDTVARLGGDEFVIVVEDIGVTEEEVIQQASQIAEKLIQALGNAYYIAGETLYVTGSIGIAVINKDHHNVDEILAQADAAMYGAKDGGRNTYRFFNTTLQHAMEQKLSLESALRMAIDEKQLYLLYQPQYNDTKCVIGAEALIRWNHPVRGLISPDQFIPIAEESRLIIDIGNWVIHEACKTLQGWQDDPILSSIVLSINIAASHFIDKGFLNSIYLAVDSFSINPKCLRIELTESIFAGDIETVQKTIKSLHEIGVSLSLDDFGTGYSSLAYLHQFLFNEIKIDQSFVKAMEHTNSSNYLIAKAIISLGEALGLTVIAEGVETALQFEWLCEMGCRRFQGYLFSKPLFQENIESMIKAKS